MRNIKKFLYGFMIASFVLIGSVSVFAVPPPGKNTKPATESVDKALECQHSQDVTTIKENKATNYTEEAQHNSWGGNVSAEFGFEAGPTPPVNPPDDYVEPKIEYKVVVNETEAWDSADCDDEYVVCSVKFDRDLASAETLEGMHWIDGSGNVVDTVKDLYANCTEARMSVQINYSYKTTSTSYYFAEEECNDGDTIYAPAEGGMTCAHTTTSTETASFSQSYFDYTGKYIAGRLNGGGKYISIDEGWILYSEQTINTANKTQEEALAAAKTKAATTLDDMYQTSIDNTIQYFQIPPEVGLYPVEGDAENGISMPHTFAKGNTLAEAQEKCTYWARMEIASIIADQLIQAEFYNIANSANNTKLINGCRTYLLNAGMWVGYGSGYDNGSPARTKLEDNYSMNDFFVHENNPIAILFPLNRITARHAYCLGVHTTGVIWDDKWNPAIVEFKERIVDVEYTGKYKDVTLLKDNASADVYIQNLNNPDSKYYKRKYFPLKGAITEFSAIRASAGTGFVYPYGDGSGFGLKVDAYQSDDFTSLKTDAQGMNQVVAYGFADIYKQRVFQMNEKKHIFAYMVSSHNPIFAEGEYIGVKTSPTTSSSSCEYKWRALFNVYGEDTLPSGTTVDSAISEEATLTQEGIYSTAHDNTMGKIIDAPSVTIGGHLICTNVKAIIYGTGETNETLFADILQKQTNLVQLTDSKGNARNGIFTNSLNAGSIYFENGKNMYPYYVVPSNLKVTLSNPNFGDVKPTEYSIEKNGIYVLAQSMLGETIVEMIEIPYTTKTTEHTTITTETITYTICIGQHNCDCEDINVLCECQDEIAGCPPTNECEENPNLPQCQGIDCTDPANASNPQCGCFDDVDGNCNCPYTDKEKCPIWTPYPDFIPDDDCLENGEPCYPGDPGGITGGGSVDYFNKFYKPSSTLTN